MKRALTTWIVEQAFVLSQPTDSLCPLCSSFDLSECGPLYLIAATDPAAGCLLREAEVVHDPGDGPLCPAASELHDRCVNAVLK